MDELRKNGSFNKPIFQILLAALVGVSGATGVQLSMPNARSDAFTGKQALEMELRLMAKFEERINHRFDEFVRHELAFLRTECNGAIIALQAKLPPQALRERVIALEEHARQQDPSYKPPTRKWSN